MNLKVKKFIKIIEILLLFGFIQFNVVNGGNNICVSQERCDKCLEADITCAWCTDKYFGNNKPRCMIKDDLIKANCTEVFIIQNSPKNEIIQNEETQDFHENSTHAIQIQPQKIRLRLVKSNTETIKMTYRPAKNNQLDLYYLMDLTWSMKDDKQTIVKMGEELAVALKNLTKNYRLGFGSFADKPAMPMMMPGTENNPCKVEHEICEPTYGFHHHLKLTKNIQKFISKVDQSEVTGNLDNLEGGLDALMQVIVCMEEIGWNKDARKIVIFATDGLMHFAGDGLLAGITKRNDKKCHLNADGEYMGTLEYDYPSLEEIYRELINKKISVIFAVTKDVATTYFAIQDLMKDISSVEILSLDSSNIIQLVNKGYQSFIRKAQFIDNSPSYISIKYETDCGGLFPERKKRNFCDQIQIGDEIEFFIHITVDDFPNDGIFKHNIRIEESGISEYLELEIEIQEPCPCMENENLEDEFYLESRYFCNYHGNFSCGMCYCDDGWTGITCSCDSHNYTTIRALENECRQSADNSTVDNINPICSNRGECECGKCYCNLGYNGKYCECSECNDCNDFERAECICGECICKNGWTGPRCNCPESRDSCLSPNSPNDEICSGHGKCDCDRCDCNDSYFGKFCEANSIAGNKLCGYYDKCIKCLIMKRNDGITCENSTEICSGNDNQKFIYDFVENFEDSEIKCMVRLKNKDDITCEHYFTYDNDIEMGSKLKIKITDCKPINYAFIGIFAFIGTLLLGFIIILVVRAITYVKDKREFANFEKQQVQTEFQLSPLYKSPITRYTVPRSRSEENL